MKPAKKIAANVINATPMMPSRGIAPMCGVMASTRVTVKSDKRIAVVECLPLLGALTAAAAPQYLYHDKKKYYRKRNLEKVSHFETP